MAGEIDGAALQECWGHLRYRCVELAFIQGITNYLWWAHTLQYELD